MLRVQHTEAGIGLQQAFTNEVQEQNMQSSLVQADEEWGGDLEGARAQVDDLVDILSQVKVFETLSMDELRQIERIVHRRVYLPEEVIVRQGAPGVGMYIIQTGSTSVLLEAEGGQRIRLATLNDGQFFGEMSLLDGAPRAASVVANDRAHLIGFFRADLMDLIEHSPRLGFKIVFHLSLLMNRRLRETLLEYRGACRSLRRLRAGR